MSKERILAIDPGNEKSAYIVYNAKTKKVEDFGLVPNLELMANLNHPEWDSIGVMGIEMIRSYGMRVGQTVFDTCLWIGRFVESFLAYSNARVVKKIYRKDNVCMHICHTTRAKDADITHAICDRYGGSMKAAKGTKKEPGPLYGFKKDIWQAMAVALTTAEADIKPEQIMDE